jgi:hypothetical protein
MMTGQRPIFQFNPDMAPDSEFEPGELCHLTAANQGRLLDARRTPVRLVALHGETGMFEVEILDFEDRGARWQYPFEAIGRFQFALGSNLASPEVVAGFRAIIERFDKPLQIDVDDRVVRETRLRLATERERAGIWLSRHSRFFASRQRLPIGEAQGVPLLYDDLQAYVHEQGLDDLEEAFATQWASNSESGEFIKGHRIVVAELGLSPFEGKIVRDPTLFEGAGNKVRRSQHILKRMAFVQEVFSRGGIERPVLYRTLSCSGLLEPRNASQSFISATFSRAVAEALFAEHDKTRTIAMYRQAVPLERLFMTYLETRQFNHPFQESEAVLIADPSNLAF